MRTLVVTASRHGTTSVVGDRISEVLRSAGHQTVRQVVTEDDDVASVVDPSGFDAVVVGGSVYTGAWLSRAVQVQELLLARGIPTYAFAVGILELTSDVTAPEWSAPRSAQTAGSRVVFGGRITRKGLSLRERSLLAMVRAKEGEYTDWDAVTSWAGAVSADLGVVAA